jgi:hypothetical protein
MARCAATKLFSFAAPLLGAGDETSGDDEASVVPLIVGHVASHVPNRRAQMPFGGPLGGQVEMLIDRVCDRASKNREVT